jgi:hypothetical protein
MGTALPPLFQNIFGRINFTPFFFDFSTSDSGNYSNIFQWSENWEPSEKIENPQKKLRGLRIFWETSEKLRDFRKIERSQKNWEVSEKLREIRKCSVTIENLIGTDQLLNGLQKTLLVNMISKVSVEYFLTTRCTSATNSPTIFMNFFNKIDLKFLWFSTPFLNWFIKFE